MTGQPQSKLTFVEISEEVATRLEVFLIEGTTAGVDMTERQVVDAALTGFIDAAEGEF